LSDAPSRIEEGVQRPAAIEIRVDGEPIAAVPGESLASALLASGRRVFRRTDRRGEPRGPYCNMGVCFECVVDVDGAPVQACMTPVRAGMHVSTGVDRARG
jgi:predicted molibdopterin-dependent oxidoreductase YjgC